MIYAIIVLFIISAIEAVLILRLVTLCKNLLVKVEILSGILEFLYSPEAEWFYEKRGYVRKQ